MTGRGGLCGGEGDGEGGRGTSRGFTSPGGLCEGGACGGLSSACCIGGMGGGVSSAKKAAAALLGDASCCSCTGGWCRWSAISMVKRPKGCGRAIRCSVGRCGAGGGTGVAVGCWSGTGVSPEGGVAPEGVHHRPLPSRCCSTCAARPPTASSSCACCCQACCSKDSKSGTGGSGGGQVGVGSWGCAGRWEVDGDVLGVGCCCGQWRVGHDQGGCPGAEAAACMRPGPVGPPALRGWLAVGGGVRCCWWYGADAPAL